MCKPAEIALWPSSQEKFSVLCLARFHLWIDQPIPTPEHKDIFCKIVAIAAACQVVPEGCITWKEFKMFLAYEIYSEIKDKEYEPRKQVNFMISKWAYDVINTWQLQLMTKNVSYLVQVEIGTTRYQFMYEVILEFIPFAVGNTSEGSEDLSPEGLMRQPPRDFRKILKNILKKLSSCNASITAQKMVDIIAKLCQPKIAQVEVVPAKKVTVELSLRIKSLRNSTTSLPLNRDLFAQKIALMVALPLDAQTQWSDFSLYTAWELFLQLRSLDYEPNKDYWINLHYTTDKVNEEALLNNVASYFCATFSIRMIKKIYEFTYELKYVYHPTAIPIAENVPLALEVPLTRLNEPPPLFCHVVNEIKAEKSHFTRHGCSVNMNDLAKVVFQKCPHAVE
ncbi:uncharacterized protein LOC106651932 [Trichogramma pretiosum]|uniref:uncharacterized protein LOC106651932 n=1 Tax=Trichogramma pretiosum TaxID=7493 RepID=UPI0006C9B92A|nr:uncharacterized protein LOC106651932 [Trichogramma pretiosum]